MTTPFVHPMGRPSRQGKKDEPTTWRERIQRLKYIPRLLGMVYETHRGYTLTVLVLRVAAALVPVTQLWVAKLIIEAVERYYRGGVDVDWQYLGTLVVVELVVTVFGDALSRGSNLLESLLADLFSNKTSVRLMRHAATLDVAQFEDADTYDHLERARRQTSGRIVLLSQFLGVLQSFITLLSLVTALAVYVPWLIVLLIVTVLPSFFGETHFARLGYSLLFQWTEQRRMLDYLRYLAASDESAKEVKLFGLSDFLIGRYAKSADEFYDENKRLSIKRASVATLLATVASLGLYGGYAYIIYLTVVGHETPAGVFTIGVLTFLMSSFRQSRGLVQQILLTLSGIYEQSLYLKDLFQFFEIEPRVRSKPDARLLPERIAGGFVFEDVSFKYPGSDQYAVRGLSCTINRGESVALVGENGAGKTTFVKLLARLYDPDEGRILLDGIDLRDYDLDDLRANIGVIFQDFLRYEFIFKENIGVGQVKDIDNVERVEAAARSSLADSVAGKLKGGFDQQLGRRFESGVTLSGGEWQKVALGRAYMRDAQVLILDEPTAALDARAEYEVFQRFTELTKGRMAVLISHRFSTVRMAERILVLKDGVLLEDGAHEELLENDGLYAELFNLQADGYR